ncbi:MAG TPA: tRNA (guanosine(37)-N1)-methyltransferase TrmD [Casimicrobiaceae bacterium]|nr:tRNA (guanosine(37)-N1)-methyltransferase TrmD [Casimicrobiaceae bacterium]
MRIEVVTLFPELVDDVAKYGVTGRARERGLWTLGAVNPRDFATDRHRTVDDRPYGGGPGMVMLAEPLEQAIAAARGRLRRDGVPAPKVIYLSPQGEPLRHERVAGLAKEGGLVLLAGRYEGIDERVIERSVDLELAVGDFVVSGGELPALLLIEAVVRQLPGALNDAQSSVEESFVAGLLDCPHYTRPEVYEGQAVPPVLLSGDHAKIARWRLKQSLGRTWLRRPELLAARGMSREETQLLEQFKQEEKEAAIGDR